MTLSGKARKDLSTILSQWIEANSDALEKVDRDNVEKLKELGREQRDFRQIKRKLLNRRRFDESELDQIAGFIYFQLLQTNFTLEPHEDTVEFKPRDIEWDVIKENSDELFKLADELGIVNKVKEKLYDQFGK